MWSLQPKGRDTKVQEGRDLREDLRNAGFEVRSGSAARISTYVPAGGRDNALVQHAGILARAVTRGEQPLLEALSEIEHWVTNYTEKVHGDDVSVEKAREKVVEFLIRDASELVETAPIPMAVPVANATLPENSVISAQLS